MGLEQYNMQVQEQARVAQESETQASAEMLEAQELMREAKMLKAQVDKENSKAEKTLTSAKKERKRLKRELVALNKLRKKAHSYRAQTRAMANYNFSPASAIPMPMGASSLYSTRYTTPAGKLP